MFDIFLDIPQIEIFLFTVHTRYRYQLIFERLYKNYSYITRPIVTFANSHFAHCYFVLTSRLEKVILIL
jgi:hypothetical protein